MADSPFMAEGNTILQSNYPLNKNKLKQYILHDSSYMMLLTEYTLVVAGGLAVGRDI